MRDCSGCGHTYGHRSFIGWIRKGETYKHGAHIPWYERLDAPGAAQMIHLRRLVETCRFHDHAPAPELLEGDPGDGNARIQAARSAAAGRPLRPPTSGEGCDWILTVRTREAPR